MRSIITIQNLSKIFSDHKKNSLFGQGVHVHAVNDISLTIYPGETLALVGESGSGKSTLGRCILKLVAPTSGKIFFEDQDITEFTTKQMLPFRQQMQVVFQDPYSSLNPRMSIREIIGEALQEHKLVNSKKELSQKVQQISEKCGIPAQFLDRYPHQFSGGQRQRIGIARALALNPKFIVCDEPVSALDVSIKAQILDLLIELQQDLNLAYLFISHDMKVVQHIADRVAVMYLGKIIEIGTKDQIFTNPKHPYTKLLLDATPSIIPREKRPLLQGEMPSNIDLPVGCAFASRCPKATTKCKTQEPRLVGDHHQRYSCFYPND